MYNMWLRLYIYKWTASSAKLICARHMFLNIKRYICIVNSCVDIYTYLYMYIYVYTYI